MAWVAVSRNGGELISPIKPKRDGGWWNCAEEVCIESEFGFVDMEIELPKGTIKKLIGRELTWEDNPVELKEDE